MGEGVSKNYWDNYYSTSSKSHPLRVPSQFAAFIASEFKELNPFLIDFGCGNGRDTHFFANHGFSVLGIDASEAAISTCNASDSSSSRAAFLCSDLESPLLSKKIIERAETQPVLLYARFFLHAINQEQEEIFFHLANQICLGGGHLAVEFRTNRDASLEKVTKSHYRRFINPLKFTQHASNSGFVTEYFTEGFGYAKFRDDDAHVARVILRKSS